MGFNKLFQIAAALAALAVVSGQLPLILGKVQVAQLHLLKDSQSSSWGQLYLLPVKK